MKRFVNGEEVDLEPSGAVVTRLSDRLMVRTKEGSASALAVTEGGKTLVSYRGQVYAVEKVRRVRSQRAGSSGEMRAPMPGLIVDILVQVGQAVQKGDKILVLEAMKTQQPFLAPFDGTVTEIAVAKSDQVVESQLLARVVEEEKA